MVIELLFYKESVLMIGRHLKKSERDWQFFENSVDVLDVAVQQVLQLKQRKYKLRTS